MRLVHRHMLDISQRLEADYRRLLDEAVRARELVPCDTARLARAIGALASGSLLGWAVYRQGTAERWVREDLETLLGPYLQRAAGTGRRPPKHPSMRPRKSGRAKV